MSKYKGKRVLVVGFGLSGVAVTQYMVKQGAKVTVTDIKNRPELGESIKACADLKIEYDLGKHTPKLFETAELITVSPGINWNNVKPIEQARALNIPIISEVDLAVNQINVPLIAVTGTNGKTTTTALIGEMFKNDNKKAFVGGNIGNPLLNTSQEETPSSFVIAELSSFQLDVSEKIVPAVAVFTNIDQDHLDRYGTLDAYIGSKKRLLKACDRNTFVILNHDDPAVAKFAEETPGKIMWFTKKNPMTIGGEFAENFCGAYYLPESNSVKVRITRTEESYSVTKLRLFGDHNKENLMAAICAARAMGVTPAAIQKTIDSFEGVPHRLEFIRKKDGVFFVNDSKATNVASLQKSLLAFKKNPIILIAGGKDKDMDFTPLASLVKQRVKILILIGEAKEKMNRALGDSTDTLLVGTFEEAVLVAYQKSRIGDIILLAPGCASYDMFRNYEERGEYFKKLVHQL